MTGKTKKDFYVQLHIHSCETSACGVSSGAEMARACKEYGYSLIVMTDHFMNANIGCPRNARWTDKVEFLFRGYRAAKAEGDKIGLTVLKGWETFTGGPEFLTYGLDEEFLLDNPDIADVPKDEYLRRVRDAGGFVIHAHPFRKAFYIPPFTPDPGSVEAFEVFNAGNKSPEFDEQALKTAREHGLIETAGSDAHHVENAGKGAMRLPEAIGTTEELVAALRSRQCEIVQKLG